MSTAQVVEASRNPDAKSTQLTFGLGGVLGAAGAATVNTSVRSFGDPS